MKTNAATKKAINDTREAAAQERQGAAQNATAHRLGDLHASLVRLFAEHAPTDVLWSLGIALEDHANGLAALGNADPVLEHTAEQVQRVHLFDARQRAERGGDAMQVRTYRLAAVAAGWLTPGAALELARNLAGIDALDFDHEAVTNAVERRRSHFELQIAADSVPMLVAGLLAVPA